MPLDSFVSAEVSLPNGGIDPRTITADTVYLERAFDGERVPAVVNTSGAGDVIVLKPISFLQAKQTYTFVVTEGLKDINGVPFTHFQSQFKTGIGVTQLDPQYKGVRFTQVPLATSPDHLRRRGPALPRHHDRPGPPALRLDQRRPDLPLADPR